MIKRNIISAVLIAVITVMNFPALSAKYVSDIDGHWAEEAFMAMEEKNLVSGYDDGSYRPDAEITRAEFFTVINRVCNATRNTGSSFSDVSEDAWYKIAVDYAYSAGYASGDGNGLFRPEDSITRAEAATAIVKAFGGAATKKTEFTDKDEIPEWALGAVDALVYLEIISGYDDNSFKPNLPITRAEAVTIFSKIAPLRHITSGIFENQHFERNVVIGASDITFVNSVFDGDVYIAAGVCGGEIRLMNCTLNGKIIFAGRDGAALVFENTDCTYAAVNSVDRLNIISVGSSAVKELQAATECDILEMDTDKGFENLFLCSGSTLSGSFEKVTVLGGGVYELTDGEIEECIIQSDYVPQLNINGSVNTLTSDKSYVLNGNTVAGGKVQKNFESDSNDNIKLSYTLARLQNDDFESEPVTGGTNTDVITDKSYVLNGLKVSSGKLLPEFSSSVTEYELILPNSLGEVELTPEKNELLECRVGDDTISGGFKVSGFEDTKKTVEIDVYGALAKQNTYTVHIIGYGVGNTGISSLNTDKPCSVEKSEDGLSYKLMLTGGIDYSEEKIPVTVSVNTVNELSDVQKDGVSVESFEVDLYENREVTVNISVISEDKSNTQIYTITVSRPLIEAIDNPDEAAVENLLSSKDFMTVDNLKKAKIQNADSDKLELYSNYLAKTAYHAEDKDIYGKQSVIQNAIDVVNEWSGKTLRIEAENYWTGTVKSFADDETQKYCIGINNWTIAFDEKGINVPEGDYTMKIRWGNKFQNTSNPVKVNGIIVYDEGIPKTWINTAVVEGTLTSDKLSDTVVENIHFNDSENTLTFTEKGSNLVLDYFELYMTFE